MSVKVVPLDPGPPNLSFGGDQIVMLSMLGSLCNPPLLLFSGVRGISSIGVGGMRCGVCGIGSVDFHGMFSGVFGIGSIWIPGLFCAMPNRLGEREKRDRTLWMLLVRFVLPPFRPLESRRRKSVRVAPASWYIGSETFALM